MLEMPRSWGVVYESEMGMLGDSCVHVGVGDAGMGVVLHTHHVCHFL